MQTYRVVIVFADEEVPYAVGQTLERAEEIAVEMSLQRRELEAQGVRIDPEPVR